MTRDELLVIAAAAAAFVIINIIMWSVIIKNECRSDLIDEISDSIKMKYINVNFDFILK